MLNPGIKQNTAAAGRSSLEFIVKYGVYSIFLIMFVIFSLNNRNFLTASNIMLLFEQSAPILIGVIGMTFVMMDGGIDISAGSNMYLSAAVSAIVMNAMFSSTGIISTFWQYLLIILVSVCVGAAIGVFNGIMISRFGIVPFIVTLITTSIARGLGMYFTNAKLIIINTMGFKFNDKTFLSISILVYIALAMIVIFHAVMRFSTFGCHLKAQGNNKEAAKKLGINTRRNTMLAYVICGALCGLAGIMSAGMNGAVPSSFAVGNEFIIIPAAVLGGISLFGGKGTILPGCIIGILLINTIVNGLTMMSANPYVYTIVRGVIIFIAVMVDNLNYKGEIR